LHPFLKNYVDQWPVRDYLKHHFRNQRGYRSRVDREKMAAEAENDITAMDDIFDFGSDIGANNGEGDN
jgi:hypothetical protein